MITSAKFKGESVEVSDSASVLYTGIFGVHVPGSRLAFEVQNLGSVAFNSFKLQLQDHPDGEWYDFLTNDDFASAAIAAMLFASTALKTLAGGAKTHIHVETHAAYAFRVVATVASGTTTALVLGSMRHI